MCDLKAFVQRHEQEDLILEAVNLVHAEGGQVVVRNLFGEEKTIHGEVREVSLTNNRVVIVAT